MALSTQILKILDQNLDIKELQTFPPTDKTTITDAETKNQAIKVANTAGKMYPTIVLNNYKFTNQDIVFFELTEKDFLPTIKVVIDDKNGLLSNMIFPKDNCIMNVYIGSGSADIRAVRCDFLVYSIEPAGSAPIDMENRGAGYTYLIKGVLNIPLMTNYDISCYNSSSYDALFEIAKKLRIGFATNEISTADAMPWIQPNIKNIDFIKDITEHAYKDDDSFFISFVDKYYNLTLVNVNEMLSQEESYDAAYLFENAVESIAAGSGNSSDNLISKDNGENAIKNILSNFTGIKGTNLYIKSYKTKSNQGEILLNKPNKENIFYYDIEQSKENDKKFLNYYIKSTFRVIDDDVVENNQNQNVRNEWFWTKVGNEHENYIYAQEINKLNIAELEKTQMVITTDGISLNLMRGMRVPIVIIKNESSEIELLTKINKRNLAKISEMEQLGFYFDEKLSGYYIIKDMTIRYSKTARGESKFETEATLWKRFWGIN